MSHGENLGRVELLCGNPGPMRLPLSVLLENYTNAYNGLSIDLQLSDQNAQLQAPITINPQARDVALPVDRSFVPMKVEAREMGADQNERWWDIEILNFGDINDAETVGRPGIAFYGSPPRAVFSGDPTGMTFRLWGEPFQGDIHELESSPALHAAFESMLVVETAITSLPLTIQISDGADYRTWVAMQSETLRWQLAEWRRRWEKSRTLSRHQGITKKRPFGASRRNFAPLIRKR